MAITQKLSSTARNPEVSRTQKILTIILIVACSVSLSRKQDFVVVLVRNCLFFILYIKLLGSFVDFYSWYIIPIGNYEDNQWTSH
jgi:hypothetical protein